MERYHSLSLAFIKSKAPEYAERELHTAEQELPTRRAACRALLEDPLARSGAPLLLSASVSQLAKDAFRNYFDAWEKCFDVALRAAWWTRIRRFLVAHADEAEAKWQSLFEAYRRISMSLRDSDLSVEYPAGANNPTLYDVDISELPKLERPQDWNLAHSEQFLNSFQSKAVFQKEDLTRVTIAARRRAERLSSLTSYGSTFLVCDPASLSVFESLTDRNGHLLCYPSTRGTVYVLSNAAPVEIIPLPSLGRHVLWYFQIKGAEGAAHWT